MTVDNLKTRRLCGLFLFGFILFDYPFLRIFDKDISFFGFPLLYAYLYGIWTIIIVGIYLATKTRSAVSEEKTNKEDHAE
jgi:hypothetical protein